MRRLLLASALLPLVAAATPDTRAELDRAERAQAAQRAASHHAAERAKAAAEDVSRLTQARIAAADGLRATEQEVSDIAARVDELAARRTAAERRLAARAAALGPMLPVIERLARYPVETMLAAPAPPGSPPGAAVRGLLVLRGLTRQLEHDAAAMRDEQEAVQRLAGAIAAELEPLRSAEAAQREQAAALDRQLAAGLAARRQVDAAAREAARRAADAAAEAGTLRTAVARLEVEQARLAAQAQAQERAKAHAQAQAHAQGGAKLARRLRDGPAAEPLAEFIGLRAPIAGVVVRRWGDSTEAGPASGMLLRGAPGARVVAPCGGRVAFAGPFRSFGLLVILDCGSATHVVLSGLDRLDAEVGDAIRAGEPVGALPGWTPGTAGPRPALYVELRRGGKPMDPAPFLQARR